MKKLTLKEIGELAGVSRATVSRVINGYPHISDDIRERVNKVIAETGFHPNFVARSLASRQSNILGVIIPSVVQSIFTDPYFPRLIQGISQGCNARHYTLTLFIFNTPEEEDAAIDRMLGNGMVDGLIMTATEDYNDRLTRPLLASGVPFVMVGRPKNSENISFIDVDNTAGAYNATGHLARLGYKRIAHIASNVNMAGHDRRSGYLKALQDRNLPVDEGLIAYGDYTEESGYLAMRQLFAQRPDAVFVGSDTMALGAMRAARDAGLVIPEDFAVVGFDDLPPATTALPPLTTVRQPIFQSGTLAVEALIDMIKNGNSPPRHIVLPVELVIRNSCGAMRALA